MAHAGAQIIVADLLVDEAEKTAEEIKKIGQEAYAVSVDVSDFSSLNEMGKKNLDKFRKIDILINNAGVTRDNLLIRMSVEDWQFVLKINLEGVFNCCKAVVPGMIKQKWGRIVNISSVVGLMGNAGQVNYSASKAGIIGLTKSLAKELAKRNITVNAIAPGFVKTQMTDKLSDETKEIMKKQIPLERFGEVDDIANACLFFISPNASYITGEVLRVDGGMAM